MGIIAELSKEIHQNARDKGFWDKERNLAEMLMLIVSELSEALEADRHGSYCMQPKAGGTFLEDKYFLENFNNNIKDTFEDELADVAIRLFDLAYGKKIDLEAHIAAKMRYNKTRERMHRKAY